MAEYKQIKEANDCIKTTDIKGKDYAEVNQRIKAFRMVFPNGTIQTEIVNLANGVVIFKASVYDEGKLLGTGFAQEKENSSFINKTSYIENCETSAVGRALGMCGFGIDISVASAEEVQNAINNQNTQQKAPTQKPNEGAKLSNDQYNYLIQLNIPNDWLVSNFGINNLQDLSEVNAGKLIQAYENKKKKGNK